MQRILKVKVSCICTLFLIIRRILNRCKILNCIFIRNNNHTAGVLTGSTLNACATYCQTVNLCLWSSSKQSALVKIFHNIAIGSLVGNSCHSTCLEHIFLTKKLLCISMRPRLILAREIKVNIRLLIAVKSKEGFKRNFVAVTLHRYMAIRTVLRRKVKARAVFSVQEKFAVLTFSAIIVRSKRINLGNTAHMSSE